MFTVAKRLRGMAPALLLLFMLGGTAAALDYNDVKNLMQNKVAEEVIINMINTDGSLYVTMEEANEMRAMGASENLIQAMRPRDTTVYGSSQTTPTVVVQTTPTTPSTLYQSTETPTVVVEVEGPVEGMPVVPVDITMYGGHPSRYDKEGWISVSNHDLMPYYILIDQNDKRIFISRSPNGGMVVDSGQNVVVNVRKATYKMYGDSGNKLEVKVRENETNRLSLNPFGVIGNSGLTGVSTERDRVRSEVLFSNYVPAPAVVIQEAPVIVVPSAPPPPVFYGPPHRRYYRGGGGGAYFRW